MHFVLRFLQIINDFSGFLIILFVFFFLFIFAGYTIYKSPLSLSFKRLLVSIFFTIFIVYTVFCGFEAYFRYVYDQSDGLGFLKTNQHWLAKHVTYNNFFYRDNKNYSYSKPPGETLIGIIGDSYTFGWGIKDVNKRFSNLLEEKLRKAGKKVSVYNLGQPGIDTCSEVIAFNKVKGFPFDIVIWEYTMNDIQPCGPNGSASTGTTFLTHLPPKPFPLNIITEKSYFIDYLYWKLSSKHKAIFTALRMADLKQYNNPPVVTLEKNNIASFSALLTNGVLKKADEKHPPVIINGSRPVVSIIFPYPSIIGPHYPAKQADLLVHQWMMQYGITNIIDLLPDLINKKPADIMVNPFDNHPNEYVHTLAAQRLYEVILPLIK